MGRNDTEGHDGPTVGEMGRRDDGPLEGIEIGDEVIGRHDEQDGLFVLMGRPQGRQRDGRGRIAPDGLEQDPTRLMSGDAQLLGNEKTVFLVADHELGQDLEGIRTPLEPGKPRSRGLQETVIAEGGEQLLGIVFP